MNEIGALLITIVGILLAIAGDYVPGFKEWFGALSKQEKRLTMAFALLVSAFIVVMAACVTPFSLGGIECTTDSMWNLFEAVIVTFITGLGGNQGMNMILSPKRTKG